MPFSSHQALCQFTLQMTSGGPHYLCAWLLHRVGGGFCTGLSPVCGLVWNEEMWSLCPCYPFNENVRFRTPPSLYLLILFVSLLSDIDDRAESCRRGNDWSLPRFCLSHHLDVSVSTVLFRDESREGRRNWWAWYVDRALLSQKQCSFRQGFLLTLHPSETKAAIHVFTVTPFTPSWFALPVASALIYSFGNTPCRLGSYIILNII